MKLALVGAAVVLTSCAVAKPIGPGAYVVECNGAMQPMANCFTKAAEVCPRGFDLAPLEHSGGLSGRIGDPYGSMSTGLSGVHKSLIVQCR